MSALLKLSLLLVLACFASAQTRRKIEYEIVNPFICKAGEDYQLDCNYCSCVKDGVGACTLMACNNGPDNCTPGTVFQMGDHLCKCPECGYKWHSDCFAHNYCSTPKIRFG